MSKKFAEKIIDSMVDSDGKCGERGLSHKQFAILSQCLEAQETDIVGGWSGDYASYNFTSTDYTGRIGKYNVTINEYFHFNARLTVKSIERVYDESEEDLESAKMEELAKINWHHEVGDRVRDVIVELIDHRQTGYNEWGETWLYKFTDGQFQFVWFTGFKDLEVGSTYKLSGTVKKLDEYNGVKQTVITRGRLKL